MVKKITISTIVITAFGILIIPFLSENVKSDYNLNYVGNITANNTIVIHNTFSGKYIGKEYNIYHDIHFKEQNTNMMNIVLNHISTQGMHNISIEDYSILTGQGNHRLTIFEQEFLKKNRKKVLSGVNKTNGLEYTSEYKKGLFIDTLSVKGIYTNQYNKKNYYNIILKIDCGISQYIKTTQKCNILGKILLDLPINKYTKNREIQGILHKQ